MGNKAQLAKRIEIMEQEPYDIERDAYADKIEELLEADIDGDDILQELERMPYGNSRGRTKIIKDINQVAFELSCGKR